METRIQVDRTATTLIASYNKIEASIRERADRFTRYSTRKIQRFQREQRNALVDLFKGLCASLDVESFPDGTAAWVRPDGVGEVVIQGPDPRVKTDPPKPPALVETREQLGKTPDQPIKLPTPEELKVTAELAEDAGGKITPMPVAASNGDGQH